MISRHPWTGFNKLHDIVACFIFVNDTFLILQRGLNKPQGGSWGLPAGKVEEGESIVEAVVRETSEETGLVLASDRVRKVQEYYVNIGTYDFLFHVYETRLDTIPFIRIDTSAHMTYKWVTSDQALTMPLIQDFDFVIKSLLSSSPL